MCVHGHGHPTIGTIEHYSLTATKLKQHNVHMYYMYHVRICTHMYVRVYIHVVVGVPAKKYLC